MLIAALTSPSPFSLSSHTHTYIYIYRVVISRPVFCSQPVSFNHILCINLTYMELRAKERLLLALYIKFRKVRGMQPCAPYQDYPIHSNSCGSENREHADCVGRGEVQYSTVQFNTVECCKMTGGEWILRYTSHTHILSVCLSVCLSISVCLYSR